jgi:putative ATPase
MREAGDPLFDAAQAARGGPLADRMRPRNLDEVAGQDAIVGPGRLLRRAIQKDQLGSILLSGPPGTGKTTLARVIANTTAARFVSLNAVLSGIADIRKAVEEAKSHGDLHDRKTILFVDEVHRWNKAQQDALLPWVENGTIVLIGATTENPFFEVNRALVSRSRVFQLRSLGPSDLRKVADRALGDAERGYGSWNVGFAEGALEHLVSVSDGDARSLLNALELAVETSVERWPPQPGSSITVDMAAAEESIQRRAILYDKDGDFHYDAASAFIKSIRGSDPDAALYWLARMVYAGEDPNFAFRRMLISAGEDIGLADPQALTIVTAAAAAFDRVGMPEGQYHLAEAALYLATAPKSNSTLGYFDALAAVQAEGAEVPNHLKDASRDAKGFGHGEGYQYPHAWKDHWVRQDYLPSSMKNRFFYKPGSLGLEGERRALVLGRREEQFAAALESEAPAAEALTWSREGELRSEWKTRAESGAAERLKASRELLFDRARPARGDRILVIDNGTGFLVWEALRRAPEGTVVALVNDAAALERIDSMASGLPELARPLVVRAPDMSLADAASLLAALVGTAGFAEFELVLGLDILSSRPDQEATLSALALAFPESRIILGETLRRKGGRLSCLLVPGSPERLLLEAAESGFYERGDLPSLGALPGTAAVPALWPRSSPYDYEELVSEYPRRFSEEELSSWLSPASPFGAWLAQSHDEAARARLAALLSAGSRRGPVPWRLALGISQH